MTFVKHTLAWLRGGTANLNEVETCLLATVIGQLSSADAQTLDAQRHSITLVQRPQPGRMTMIFYSTTPPLFDNRGDEVCIAEVAYKAVTGRRRKVRLVAHAGCIRSIEGSIPSTIEEVQSASVSIWPNVKSNTARAIDRLEHGAGSDQ